MGQFSTRPLYLQVREALVDRIASGEWASNAAIPAEPDLAREFGVSAGTMRKALDMLELDGLVTRRQGRGTYVNDPSSPKMTTRYNNIRDPDGKAVSGESRVLEIVQCAASHAEQARLNLGGSDQVVRVRRVRTHMSTPFLVEDVSLPASLFPGLSEKADLCSLGIVAIARAYGMLLGKAVKRITLSAATPAATAAFNIAPGSPILALDRVVENNSGQPAEWRVAECMTSVVRYEVESS